MSPHPAARRRSVAAASLASAAAASLAALLGLSALAATEAEASSLTLTWIPGSIASFSHGPGAVASGSGALPEELLFDASLGTLEAAEVRYVGTAFVSKSLDVAPGSYTAVASLDLRLVHAPSGLDVVLNVPLGFSDVQVEQAGAFVFGEGNARFVDLATTSGLGVFVTGGVLELTVSGRISVYGPGGLVYSGLGDALGGQSRSGDAITYSYVPVPEPGSGVLAGLGLAWLAAYRRRAAR